MPEVTSHVPGSFCWIELNTSDTESAKKFYSGLFDWAMDDMPAGPDMVYTMVKMRGLEVGAICSLQPEQKAHGIPPHWMSYVAVESADSAAAKASSLGGTVLAGAFDVMDVGRMAVIQDPLGATFCVWQAKSHIGARYVGEIGTFCWDELWTTDTGKAAAFYKELLGWTAKESDLGEMGKYVEWQNRGQAIGGMLQIAPEMGPVPPNWLPYFMVGDCDATASKAKASGGTVAVPPQDIPHVGRFSIIRDPQGATFAIIKLANQA